MTWHFLFQLLATEEGHLFSWGRNDFGQASGVRAGVEIEACVLQVWCLPGVYLCKLVTLGRHHCGQVSGGRAGAGIEIKCELSPDLSFSL